MFYPGTELFTESADQNILATATVPENFPAKAGVYDLNMFLSVLSLFDKPDIEFNDESFTISAGRSHIEYRYCAPSLIKGAGKRSADLSKYPVIDTFNIGSDVLKQAQTAASVLGLPHFIFEGGDTEKTLRADDVKNKESNTFVRTLDFRLSHTRLLFAPKNSRLSMIIIV
jgi:hypothetical protein